MVDLSRRHKMIGAVAKFAAFLLIGFAIWSMGKNSFYFMKMPDRYSTASTEAIRRNFLGIGSTVNDFLKAGGPCTPSHFTQDGQLLRNCSIVSAGNDCFLVIFGLRCGTVLVDAAVAEIPGVLDRLNKSTRDLCANMPPLDPPPRSLRFTVEKLGCNHRINFPPVIVNIIRIRD